MEREAKPKEEEMEMKVLFRPRWLEERLEREHWHDTLANEVITCN